MAKKKLPKKEWLATEKIVAALEKFISPISKVEHNALLPVIGKPNREPRQIDVAVTTKLTENRTHLTIIEVQDRKNKPDVTTFGGWIKKMQEVGANQLICVSEKGFPDSIIDEVISTYGHNIVTLMTLKEFDDLLNPQRINVDFLFDINEGTFDITDIKQIYLEESASKYLDLGIDTKKNVFDTGNGERLTLNELIKKALYKITITDQFKKDKEKYNEFPYRLLFDYSSRVYVYLNNERFQIIKWEIDLKLNIFNKPLATKIKKICI